MEHECSHCKNVTFNNQMKLTQPCESCGGRHFCAHHDEFGTAGCYWVNIHTCENCKKNQNNSHESAAVCDCGCERFSSQISDETKPRATVAHKQR